MSKSKVSKMAHVRFHNLKMHSRFGLFILKTIKTAILKLLDQIAQGAVVVKT